MGSEMDKKPIRRIVTGHDAEGEKAAGLVLDDFPRALFRSGTFVDSLAGSLDAIFVLTKVNHLQAERMRSAVLPVFALRHADLAACLHVANLNDRIECRE